MKNKIKYLQNEGIPHQLLYKKQPHNYDNDPFKSIHENYIGVTGLKIQNGPIKDGRNLLILDIDCKGIPEEGRQAYRKIIEKFPILSQTYHEKTKSGGYHLLIYSDLEAKGLSKWVFNTPFGIEVPPGEKLEIELFLKGAVTIAPTRTYEGIYIPLNNQGIKFIPKKDLQEILYFIQSNSLNDTSVKDGGNSQGEYRGEKIQGVDLKKLISILEINNLKYKIKGKNIKVWGYGDTSKNGDFKVNFCNRSFYLWNVKDQSAKKPTIREYVESQGREYQGGESQKAQINQYDKVFKLNSGQRLSENPEFYNYLVSTDNKEVVLLDSGCGTGKTTVIIKVLKEWGKVGDIGVITVPMTSNKHQLKQDYPNLIEVGGKTKEGKKCKSWTEIYPILKSGDIVVCCYEALKNVLPKELYNINVVMDEGHLITDSASFRSLHFLVNKLREAKRGVILSGTTWDLPKIYSKSVRIDGGKKFNVKLRRICSKGKTFTQKQKMSAFEKFKSTCQKNDIPIVVVVDTKIDTKQEYLGFEVVTAENKEHEWYQGLLEGIQVDDLIGFTLMIGEGINIKTQGRIAIWLDVENKNTRASTSIQLPQRWREAEWIYLYVVDKPKKRRWYSDDEIKKDIEKTMKSLNEGKFLGKLLVDILHIMKDYICMEEGKFNFKDDFFKTYKSLVNGESNYTDNTLRWVSKRTGWDYKSITIDDMGEDEPAEKKGQPKKVLREIFTEKISDDVELKMGTVTLIKDYIKYGKVGQLIPVDDRLRSLYAEFYEAMNNRNIEKEFNRKCQQWKKAEDLYTTLIEYFRVPKKINIASHIEGVDLDKVFFNEKLYFLDNRYFSKSMKIISGILGHIFVIGQTSKNIQLVKCIFKEKGYKVSRSKNMNNIAIYKNPIKSNRGTKAFKEQHKIKKQLIKKIKENLEN